MNFGKIFFFSYIVHFRSCIKLQWFVVWGCYVYLFWEKYEFWSTSFFMIFTFFHPSANFENSVSFCKIDLWDTSYGHLWDLSEQEVDWKWTGSDWKLVRCGMRGIYKAPCVFCLTKRFWNHWHIICGNFEGRSIFRVILTKNVL